MALNGVISNLLSLGANLLPFVKASAQAPSSSSSPLAESQQIEADLESLMKVLKRIKATLQDAEEREIRDKSVKLWLRELKEVAYDAEDVLDMYDYEVLRVQVEARDASAPNPRKRKQQVQLPDDMSKQIKQIKGRFDEICKHREDLRLREEDGPRCCYSEWQITPTGPFVVESDIFGYEREKEELIDLLSPECHDGNVVSVVTVVGQGGVGKTTLAQLAYNNQRIRQRFSKFGWVCVSEDFNVQRLMRESIESITNITCDLTNLGALQETISKEIRGERILLVLDDVWNENVLLWESLRAPFTSAALVKILVTTRNESVAQIMQTVPTFNLSCLSEEHSWLLFEHHAFGRVNRYDNSNLVKVGKQIIKKCGRLPLAIKSIASLLRHEPEEENWKDVLESELWNSDARMLIFAPLQISYARLPTHLKPCFLYCSMFPKDYEYAEKELVALWISQGYIESNGKRNTEKIGREYAKQLRHRSFFEDHSAYFKLHDMVHDLARLNSENGCYSIEAGKVPIFPEEQLYHLYVDDDVELVEPLPASFFTSLRTVVGFGAINVFSTVGFSKAQNLRALELKVADCELEFFSSIVNLKHLRYLSLEDLPQKLPECICSLYHLLHLTLKNCDNLSALPISIENLVSLEELVISNCNLQVLPVSFCQLKALTKLRLINCYDFKELPNDIGSVTYLQTLKICLISNFRSFQPTFSKFAGIQAFNVQLNCETIGWLKVLVNLKGTLCLENLHHVHCLTDVQCANLVSMHNLERLMLYWRVGVEPCFWMDKVSELWLRIRNQWNTLPNEQGDFPVLDRLQPHQNLRELHIVGYDGVEFPRWIRDPTSCASLEKIVIKECKNLTSLPFGRWYKLKYLTIDKCLSLRFLSAESLPSELQGLTIWRCRNLTYVPAIQKLKSLVKLVIGHCDSLYSLVTDTEPSIELTSCTNESLRGLRNLWGLRNLSSLRSLWIDHCPSLQPWEVELLHVEPCKVEVCNCPSLKEWCLQQSIPYEDCQACSFCLERLDEDFSEWIDSIGN